MTGLTYTCINIHQTHVEPFKCNNTQIYLKVLLTQTTSCGSPQNILLLPSGPHTKTYAWELLI